MKTKKAAALTAAGTNKLHNKAYREAAPMSSENLENKYLGDKP